MEVKENFKLLLTLTGVTGSFAEKESEGETYFDIEVSFDSETFISVQGKDEAVTEYKREKLTEQEFADVVHDLFYSMLAIRISHFKERLKEMGLETYIVVSTEEERSVETLKKPFTIRIHKHENKEKIYEIGAVDAISFMLIQILFIERLKENSSIEDLFEWIENDEMFSKNVEQIKEDARVAQA